METYTRGKQTKLALISSRFAFCFTTRAHLFHVLRARNIYIYIESAQTRSIGTFIIIIIIIAIIIIIIKTAMTKYVLIIIIISH